MAALTSSDWTIALVTGLLRRNPRVGRDGTRLIKASMTLATTGTYPSGGIPVPTTASTWGFARSFEHIMIYDASQADGKVVKYSATGNVIRIYQDRSTSGGASLSQADLAEMATTATAGTGGTFVLYVEATGY